jgi:hypothetical protein
MAPIQPTVRFHEFTRPIPHLNRLHLADDWICLLDL